MRNDQPPPRKRHRPERRPRLAPRRTTDVVEALTAWALTVCAIVGVLGALAGGGSVHRQQLERARQERAQWTPVVLTVTQNVSVARSLAGRGVIVSVPTAVSWQGPDGQRHHGIAQLTGPYSAGQTVPGWVDQAQRLVSSSPLSPVDALLAAFWWVVGVLIGEACVLAFVWWSVTRWTMARNRERWAREWALVEPVWSGREPRRSEDAEA